MNKAAKIPENWSFYSHILGGLWILFLLWGTVNILQLAGGVLCGLGVGHVAVSICQSICRSAAIRVTRVSYMVAGLLVGELTLIGAATVALLMSPQLRHSWLVAQPLGDSIKMLHVPLIFWGMYLLESVPAGSSADNVSSPLEAAAVPETAVFDHLQSGDMPALRTLVSHNPKAIQACNQVGQTPLHVAVESGDVEAARTLLAYGARMDAKDNQSRTPYEVAIAKQDSKMQDLLRQHGARDRDGEG